NLNSSKRQTQRRVGPVRPKSIFELPTRLIPCGGLHLTCVEGPPTCGNFRAHYKTLIARLLVILSPIHSCEWGEGPQLQLTPVPASQTTAFLNRLQQHR